MYRAQLHTQEAKITYHCLNALPSQEAIDRRDAPLLFKPAATAAVCIKKQFEEALKTTEPDLMMQTFVRYT